MLPSCSLKKLTGRRARYCSSSIPKLAHVLQKKLFLHMRASLKQIFVFLNSLVYSWVPHKRLSHRKNSSLKIQRGWGIKLNLISKR